MKKKILVTGAGGGGSSNLISSLRASDLDLEIYGSNLESRMLAKSNADHNFLLPAATEDNYLDSLVKQIELNKIGLIIPNNDREVKRISIDRELIPCRVFLPPNETVEVCQDKYQMYLRLVESGIHVARSVDLTDYNDIERAFEELADTGDRLWVRLKTGSGSKGATWVKTVSQAHAWISMWDDLRGYGVDKFMICEFLPGRDYAFQSVWRDGELIVAKMCERLSYFMGTNRLSGMSSTPEVACTVRDEKTLETIFNAIRVICKRPHGNFNLDLKGDAHEAMNVTEFNIGRFCMITPIFDLTGKINTAEAHVRSAYGEDMEVSDPIDIEEDIYLLRDLDTLPTLVSKTRLDELDRTASFC